MGKNPLDLHRKLRRYHQNVKILRRGLQVSIGNLQTESPDFALGTYQVKGSTQYSLIINLDLPKKSIGLRVDFWGFDSHKSLQHLNQGRVNLVNRDARVKFFTYPKTRYIFMTFNLEFDDDSENDQLSNKNSNGKQKCHYVINYVFIESKNPIPRSLETPGIPSYLHSDYKIECVPRLVIELGINEILEDFKDKLPINLEIFEHELLVYLLQKDTSPEYLDILKKNIQLCLIQYHGQPSQFREIEAIELKKLQEDIRKASHKLEEYLVRIDNLINHKHSLENMLDQPDDMTPYEKEQYDNKIKVFKELIEALNLKLNHVKKLQDANSNDEIKENDRINMNEILIYYSKRILADLTVIDDELQTVTELYMAYQNNILGPKSDRQNKDQVRLDFILGDYRKLKQKCEILKEHLDEKIIKFMSLWYQFLVQKNYSRDTKF